VTSSWSSILQLSIIVFDPTRITALYEFSYGVSMERPLLAQTAHRRDDTCLCTAYLPRILAASTMHRRMVRKLNFKLQR